MTLFLFYPRQPNGVAPAFEAEDLPSAEQALEEAGRILDDYPTAGHVEIWTEDRAVASRRRGRPTVRLVDAEGD